MSEPVEEVKASKPWQWPRAWVSDEKFWREVTARALSGIIVVLVAYLYGLMTGYFGQPTGPFRVFMVFLLVAVTVGLVMMLIESIAGMRTMQSRGMRVLNLLWLTTTSMCLLAVIVIVIVVLLAHL
jgi:hypothetical protein